MANKRRSGVKGKKHTQRDLERIIYKFFAKHKRKRFNPKQVAKKLKVANNKDSIQHAIEKLVDKGVLRPLEDYKYIFAGQMEDAERISISGRIDIIQSGAAFVITESLDKDIYIPGKYTLNAFQGDLVEVQLLSNKRGRRPEGKVTKVIERAKSHFIGTFYKRRKEHIVVIDSKGPSTEVSIQKDEQINVNAGDKVIIQIIDWNQGNFDMPIGKINTVLGLSGTSEVEMQSILINNGFTLDFPTEVMEEVAELEMEISEEELNQRMDMREVLTFTIDPLTAKDFDDAISIKHLDHDKIEIGVHIADVTHYVKEGSNLDKEALDRSTSVYLVDRVLPMLPEKLSNGLCSLVPNEDRFTFSAVFVFDQNFQVVERRFGKSIIHSNYRLTYEQAQRIIEGESSELSKDLLKLNEIAQVLRKRKFKKGAISFESDEVQFELDETGFPIDIKLKERKEAHMLVEDFMLLANREIATFISKKSKPEEIPFVYRVHDRPDPDKIADFASFASELGFNFKINDDKEIAASFKSLQEAAKENEQLKMLEPLAIRTMSKAIYDTENIGHYGLAFVNYCHFTSPIRRYADVLVHRILQENLSASFRRDKTVLTKKCRHISAQERKAMEAERESIKYKQAEYFEKHIGETFEGFINGIIDKGIFVSLAHSRAEGLITFDHFLEPFEIAHNRMKAQGQSTGLVLKMGDKLSVKIQDVNLNLRQLSLLPVLSEGDDF